MSNETAPGRGGRLSELDSLRGVTSVFVVCAHVNLAPFYWAWSLMDMFFVMSSFLLTQIVRKQCVDGYGVLSFYGRRIERIWPLYMLTVSVLFLVTLVLNHAGNDFSLEVFTRLFTFSQYSETMFDPVAGYEYLYYTRHLWSLGVEEQFYVILPLAMLLLRRTPVAVWLSLLLAVALFATLRRQDHANMYVLTSHLDGFAFGSLLALGLPLLAERRALGNRLLGVMALIGIAGMVPYLFRGYALLQTGVIPGYEANAASFSTLLWTSLIGLLALNRGSRWLAPMRYPPFVHTGYLSYSLYLIHYPILRLLPKAISRVAPGLSHGVVLVICLVLTFVLAELLYLFVDRRLQNKKPFKVQRPAPAIAAAS